MRHLHAQAALKKANALIQKMPSAVVIINDAMRDHRVQRRLRHACSPNVAPARLPGIYLLEGMMLSESCPSPICSTAVLKSGEDILDRDLRYQNRPSCTPGIFTIEKHCVVGGILQDITEPAVRKAEVIRKAQEVIQRSLQTTQNIACLLGENAAESEITLNSIIESFSPAKPEEPKDDNDWRKLYRR